MERVNVRYVVVCFYVGHISMSFFPYFLVRTLRQIRFQATGRCWGATLCFSSPRLDNIFHSGTTNVLILCHVHLSPSKILHYSVPTKRRIG